MKLSEHTEYIRQLIDKAFRNRLGRMGISENKLSIIESVPSAYRAERIRMETIREVFIAETGTVTDAYEKLVEELTFTLFNRLAALKVMEAHTLHPEIVTRRANHGGRSFAHLAWLEQNPQARSEEADGLLPFFEEQLQKLGGDIPLFSPQHPYHLLPTVLELLSIINAFNQVETDAQVEADIWKSDDVLGWLYESYNNSKKAAHKASGEKTEYNKVSIQSQVYTPRWVVQFLVDNSLGKLYLEMYPDSEIVHKYKIANAPATQTRERKPLHEIEMIDPATGSGNFLLYGFDLFYDLYTDQIENYGADYDKADIPRLIIENNLHGVDLDNRAIQLAQLGLYIKAKRKRRAAKIEHFNIVSSDFYLPDYDEVQQIFEDNTALDARQKEIIRDIWNDLQQAYKFGSLIRLEEKLSIHLHGLKQDGLTLFGAQEVENYETFKTQFFANLQKAVAQNTARQGQTFLNNKTQDAITFLQLLTQKYDVAVANPPYTDSTDFGLELKKFVEANYRQPYKFNTNLYAVFIKRCCEITTDDGYVGIIHPHTFMFIKTFEDVRKYLIEHTHIDIMVDYGLDRVNLFGPGILLDATWYVLSKKKKETAGIYFNITANQQEKAKQASLEQAYEDALNNRSNPRLYTLPQEKLKIIEGWPFIYWISDGFREKFKGFSLEKYFKTAVGLMTGNNDRFLRFWWEVIKKDVSINYNKDKKKWVTYQKGGAFNKWFGNNWLVVNFEEDGKSLASTTNKIFYFKSGITYSATSTKGVSYRILPPNSIFDIKGSCVFPLTNNVDVELGCAYLNSTIATYIVKSLNSTVETQTGDVKRIPFVIPSKEQGATISKLSRQNIEIKRNNCSYNIIETNFIQSPLKAFQGVSLKDRVSAYLNYENAQITQVLINEAIINELIFEVYELSDTDREQVESKMGKSIGSLPVMEEAKNAFLAQLENPLNEVREHIQSLTVTTFDEQKIREIKEGFATLYQSNNDLEEFCIRHQVNPINVWYWFKEANILPQARAAEIALEFLADSIRTLLQQDEDGIIPLVGLPGEEALSQRLEKHCLQNGFTSAQYMQLDSLLGRPINEYLEHHFFNQLSNHLNLFMYLPKTPFIWHLSSGSNQGFEAYILIYKWNRDSLFKLKSKYISQRVQNLEYRQITLQDVNTAQAQAEKEKIRLQLQEIEVFKTKIEELIAEGYDPKLDDGVGKNIAPLQKKGLLRAEVLKTTGGKKSQLEKYLHADW
ncbi:MAG: BREX-1 system adenine-specific DNA-methyltransferase PglX [Porphyromonadaceae bacterium]|nr:BREX-1 system adenine-specific DNA-methyltransferase PglX [Porphyromonadaceae bacterium]